MRSSRTFRLGPTVVAATVVALGLGVGIGGRCRGRRANRSSRSGVAADADVDVGCSAPRRFVPHGGDVVRHAVQIDSRPNTVAGSPVHWIYAFPADGQDRFSTFASTMQTDWEVIDSWWRGRDPTRAPRSDLAQFTCGTQLDLSAIRLPQSSDQLAAPESPFDTHLGRADRGGLHLGALEVRRLLRRSCRRPGHLRRCGQRPAISRRRRAAHQLVSGRRPRGGRRARALARDGSCPFRRAERVLAARRRAHVRQRPRSHVPLHGRDAAHRVDSRSGPRRLLRTLRSLAGSAGRSVARPARPPGPAEPDDLRRRDG